MTPDTKNRRGRRLLDASCAALLVLLLVGPLAWFVLSRADDALPAYPFNEDSFYYFAVADRLSHGEFAVGARGEYENGFQPLYAALLVPEMGAARLAAPGHEYRYLALRLAYVLHLGLLVLCACLCGLVVRRAARLLLGPTPALVLTVGTLCAVALALFNLRLTDGSLNGLETGVVGVLVLALLLLLLPHRRLRGEDRLFPLLCALVVLARIDALAFALPALVVHETLCGRTRLAQRVADWAVFAAGCGWWFVVNAVLTGTPIPSSGAAYLRGTMPVDVYKNAYESLSVLSSLGPLQTAALALVQRPLSFAGAGEGVRPYCRVLSVLFLLAVAGVALAAARKNVARPIMRSLTLAFAPLAIYGLCVLGFYVTMSAAPWFIPRYLTPLVLAATLFEGIILAVAVNEIAARRRAATIAAVAVIAVLSLQAAWTYARSMAAFRDAGQIATYSGHYAMVKDLPPSVAVGSFQSGVLSYFRPTTINLDGKMNLDALAAVRNGEMLDYVLQNDIEYIVDWPGVVPRYMPPAFDDRYELVASKSQTGVLTDLWRRRSATE